MGSMTNQKIHFSLVLRHLSQKSWPLLLNGQLFSFCNQVLKLLIVFILGADFYIWRIVSANQSQSFWMCNLTHKNFPKLQHLSWILVFFRFRSSNNLLMLPKTYNWALKKCKLYHSFATQTVFLWHFGMKAEKLYFDDQAK